MEKTPQAPSQGNIMSNRFVLALLATTTLASPAFAQASATAGTAGTAPRTQATADGQGLEKVVVTARKREEDQQAVPISITALSQADLDKLNVKTIEDLKYVSPSVYIAPTAFRQDALNITIRGQRNFDAPSGGGNPGLAFDTASAVYKDGVYYARALGLTGSLFDLDNVAVLKGPQGTLVGRNTTGGAILYNSREPGPNFGGYVQATVGDYARAGLQGAVNLPLTDTLFLRVALNSENQKGYIGNYFFDPATGRHNTQAGMGFKKLAGVISAKWQPDETFNLVVRADISSEHDTGSTYHDLGYFVGTVASAGRTSICNIPVTCIPFTDLRGQVMQPYYLTANASGVSNPNPSPQAYNAILASVLREQNYGFWSAEQDISNLSAGHYGTYSATANKTFGDIDVRLMAAFRTF
jgi:iron complex outermembrane receptor protein